MTAFVDTGVWYAAADRGDRSNARAHELLAEAGRLVTTDHVLVETWRLLAHRLGRHAAERFWASLRGGVAEVVTVGPADLEAAWAIGERYGDQDFSLVDRTSFAVMVRLGVTTALAFDRDFAVFGWGPGNRRRFDVPGA